MQSFFSATVTNLQQKAEALTTANTLMKEDLAIAKNTILQLQEENSRFKEEKETLLQEHHRHVMVSIKVGNYVCVCLELRVKRVIKLLHTSPNLHMCHGLFTKRLWCQTYVSWIIHKAIMVPDI